MRRRRGGYRGRSRRRFGRRGRRSARAGRRRLVIGQRF